MAQPPVDYVVGLADLDASRRHKLINLPEIIRQWVEPYGGLAGRRVLDFGCGFGEMAAGIALHCDPAMVVGVDINDQPLKGVGKLEALLGKNSLPANLRLEQVRLGELGSLDQVDVIVSWSVTEHVSRKSLAKIFEDQHNLLSRGGLMMLQVSPLYFSPYGGHLWACGYGPWEHLSKSHQEILDDIRNCDNLNENQIAYVSSMFSDLNKITAQEISELLRSNGFEIVRYQIDKASHTPPSHLLSAYKEEALTTEQAVYLAIKK